MSEPRDSDRLGPDLLDEPLESAEHPSEGLRRSILETVRPETRFRGFADRIASFLDLDASAAREILREAAEATSADWREAMHGVRLFDFVGGERVREAHCGLVRVAPDVAFPRHDHTGDEWTFVLQGEAVEEGTGRVFRPGDLLHSEQGTSHAFHSVGREPFVFVVVLEGPVKVHKGNYLMNEARRILRRARS